MKVILNVHTPSCIKFGVQYCNTPEGFESIREMHPEDDFIIANEDSFNRWELFTDFCEEMGWNVSDFFAMTNIEDTLA